MFGISLQGIAVEVLARIVAAVSDDIRDLFERFVIDLRKKAKETENDWDNVFTNLLVEVAAVDRDEEARKLGEKGPKATTASRDPTAGRSEKAGTSGMPTGDGVEASADGETPDSVAQ